MQACSESGKARKAAAVSGGSLKPIFEAANAMVKKITDPYMAKLDRVHIKQNMTQTAMAAQGSPMVTPGWSAVATVQTTGREQKDAPDVITTIKCCEFADTHISLAMPLLFFP